MVIVCDDEDRENEGDLTMAAQFATPEKINFMAKDGRGLICLTLTPQRCGELDLPPMTSHNEARLQTAFTVSVEAREGVTTGISAADRAHTIQVAIDPDSRPEDLVQPGPRVPAAGPAGRRARARRPDRGRRGPRAARRPQSGRCHLRDHERRRHHGAACRSSIPFARKHGLKIITVADLIKYRRRTEHLVRRAATVAMPTKYGDFKAIGYEIRPRRQPPRGARQGRRRRQAGRAGARALRVPHRRRVRLAALRLRRPARGGHAARRGGGPGRRALHAPGGPRHRPAQQAQGLRSAGAGLRHRRGQRGAGLRPGPARLRHRRADPGRPRPLHHPPPDQQPQEDRRAGGLRPARHRAGSRSRCEPQDDNRCYLRTKRDKMGHMLEHEDLFGQDEGLEG